MTNQKQKQRSVTMLVAGLVVLAGLSVSVRGVWLAWRPGGWMAAGLLIALPALCVAYDAFREKR
jgi:hypothetical protein